MVPDHPLDAEAHLLATAQIREWGYKASVWNGSQVRRVLEPDLSVPDDAAVVVCPDEGRIEGRTLVARLVEDATGAGARLVVGSPVTEIVVTGNKVTALA